MTIYDQERRFKKKFPGKPNTVLDAVRRFAVFWGRHPEIVSIETAINFFANEDNREMRGWSERGAKQLRIEASPPPTASGFSLPTFNPHPPIVKKTKTRKQGILVGAVIVKYDGQAKGEDQSIVKIYARESELIDRTIFEIFFRELEKYLNAELPSLSA